MAPPKANAVDVLQALAARGLVVGPAELLALRTVLARPGDWDWDRFVRVVASVVATSPAELTRVAEALETWRRESEPLAGGEPESEPIADVTIFGDEPVVPEDGRDTETQRAALVGWIRWAGVALLLLLIGWSFAWSRAGSCDGPEPPAGEAAGVAASGLVEQVEPAQPAGNDQDAPPTEVSPLLGVAREAEVPATKRTALTPRDTDEDEDEDEDAAADDASAPDGQRPDLAPRTGYCGDRADPDPLRILTSDGGYVLQREREQVVLYGVSAKERLGEWSAAEISLTTAAVQSADNGLLVALSLNAGGLRLDAIALDEGAPAGQLWQADASAGPMSFLGFAAEGELLLTAHAAEGVRVLRAATGEEATPPIDVPVEDGAVTALARWADGSIAIGTAGGVLRRGDPGATTAVALHRGLRSVDAVAALPGGRLRYADRCGFVGEWVGKPGGGISAVDGERLRVLAGGERPPVHAAWSPDGSRVLTVGPDNFARVLSLEGDPSIVLSGHSSAVMWGAWSPDGERVLTTSGDRSLRIWTLDGQAPVLLEHTNVFDHAAWSPDGNQVLTLADGELRLWTLDAEGGSSISLVDSRCVAAAWSPEGDQVLSASRDSAMQLWNADGRWQRSLPGLEGPDVQIGWSPDGGRLLAYGDDDRVVVLSRDGGDQLVLEGHTGIVNDAKWSPHGERVLTVSSDKTARIWALDGSQPVVLRGHPSAVVSGRWSPDATRLMTRSSEGTARIWPLDGTEPRVLLPPSGDGQSGTRAVTLAEWSPDGSQLLILREGNHPAIWGLAEPVGPLVLRGHEGDVWSAAFSPDGARVLTAGDRTARLWTVDGSRPPSVLVGHEDHVLDASFNAAGERVVTASMDRTARLWSGDGSAELTVLRGHEASVRRAAFSPDGTRVATAAADHTALLWSVEGGEPLRLSGHEADVWHVAFSPAGELLVTTSDDKTARLWRVADGAEVAVLEGHEGPVRHAVFSPDGSQLVTGSMDETARLWTVDGSQGPIVLDDHVGWLTRVATRSHAGDGPTPPADGPSRQHTGHLATASVDGDVLVWTLPVPGIPLRLRGCGGPAESVVFSPDGERVLATCGDGTARVWMVHDPSNPAVLRGHEGAVWRGAFSPDGASVVTASADKTARVWSLHLPLQSLAFAEGGASLIGLPLAGNLVHRRAFSGASADPAPEPAPEASPTQPVMRPEGLRSMAESIPHGLNVVLFGTGFGLLFGLLTAAVWFDRRSTPRRSRPRRSDARRSVRRPLPEPRPVRVEGDLTRFWLSPRPLTRPVLLDRRDRDDLSRGLGHHLLERPSRHVNAEATVVANLGNDDAFELRFLPKRSRRKALLLLDQRTGGLAPRRLVEEILSCMGDVDCQVGSFIGWPDRVQLDDGRSVSLGSLEDERSGLVVVVISDGKAMSRTSMADERARVLRTLSRFPRLAWAHPGTNEERRSWAALLRPAGVPCFGLDGVVSFLASGGEQEDRRRSSSSNDGLGWLWAACCALFPLPVHEHDALALRAALALPVSPMALHELRSASVHPTSIQFKPAQRAYLLRRLGASLGSERGAPPLVARAVRFWKERLIGGDEDWQADHTGPGVHRRLLVALLELWVNPKRASIELFALKETPYFAALKTELAVVQPAGSGAGGVDLPFHLDELDGRSAERLARVGLQGSAGALVEEGGRSGDGLWPSRLDQEWGPAARKRGRMQALAWGFGAFVLSGVGIPMIFVIRDCAQTASYALLDPPVVESDPRVEFGSKLSEELAPLTALPAPAEPTSEVGP